MLHGKVGNKSFLIFTGKEKISKKIRNSAEIAILVSEDRIIIASSVNAMEFPFKQSREFAELLRRVLGESDA